MSKEIAQALRTLAKSGVKTLEEVAALLEKQAEPKVKKIDWSKMPKDTLVEIRDGYTSWKRRYFSRYFAGKAKCYDNGQTSRLGGMTCDWDQIRLIENEPKPWFGGECPVPEGVKVKVWFRNGESVEGPSDGYSGYWRYGVCNPQIRLCGADIIAYQILGPMEGWE